MMAFPIAYDDKLMYQSLQYNQF